MMGLGNLDNGHWTFLVDYGSGAGLKIETNDFCNVFFSVFDKVMFTF